MELAFHSVVEDVFRQDNQKIARWLQGRFPRVPDASVQDAVAEAFAASLVYSGSFVAAWQGGGRAKLVALIRQVAWRHLRGHLRKKATQCEVFTDDIAELAGLQASYTLHDRIDGRHMIAQAMRLIDQAAVRFGGSRPDALRAALCTRLQGCTDAEAARAHGIPREYLNRAKRWVCARLRSA